MGGAFGLERAHGGQAETRHELMLQGTRIQDSLINFNAEEGAQGPSINRGAAARGAVISTRT